MDKKTIRNLIFTAVFTGLFILGTYTKIPVGPVPINLANLFLLLAAIFLGPWWGAVSVVLYLFLGALGLQVFSNGGGIAILFGPTGGYLFGYLLSVIVTGLIMKAGKKSIAFSIPAVLAGITVIYLTGVPWLKFKLDMDWTRAFQAGCLPFIIGDLIKAAVAVGVWVALKGLWERLAPDNSTDA